MEYVKVALLLLLLLAVGIGLGAAFSGDPTDDSTPPTQATAAERAKAPKRAMKDAPEMFRTHLGLAKTNFVPTGWERPAQPDREELTRSEKALMERFRSGNLQRIANGSVFVDPQTAKNTPRDLKRKLALGGKERR